MIRLSGIERDLRGAAVCRVLELLRGGMPVHETEVGAIVVPIADVVIGASIIRATIGYGIIPVSIEKKHGHVRSLHVSESERSGAPTGADVAVDAVE